MFFSNVTNNNFKTAIYIRVSREDGDKQESESIGNQRDIIKRYIKENGLQFVDEYVDDGISGTTFDREGFNRMIKDCEEKKINIIITKDTSKGVKMRTVSERNFRNHPKCLRILNVYLHEFKKRLHAFNKAFSSSFL